MKGLAHLVLRAERELRYFVSDSQCIYTLSDKYVPFVPDRGEVVTSDARAQTTVAKLSALMKFIFTKLGENGDGGRFVFLVLRVPWNFIYENVLILTIRHRSQNDHLYLDRFIVGIPMIEGAEEYILQRGTRTANNHISNSGSRASRSCVCLIETYLAIVL